MAIEVFIAIAVLFAGASYVQAKKAQKKAKELTEGVEANIESNSKEIPVVYGKRRVGGVRVYIDTSRDKKHQYLYMVLAMAEGEVESITDIKIDDISIEDDRFNYDGLLSERNLEFEVFLGSDGQEASTLIGNGVSYDYDRLGEIYNDPFADQHERDAQDPNRVLPWSSKHKLSGIAYLALKFKWDEGAYTGIPDVTAVVKGRKVYDPRTGTTAWSDNPALCIRDYLTNERFGKGLPASAIDDAAFIKAANDLDSFIAYPYQDSPEYQYLFRMNHVVDTSKKIMENLNEMIIACRGFIPYSNGVYSLKIDQTSSSVLDISPDQIISGIAVAGARKEDRFNQVKVNFFNASLNYKEDQAIYPEQNSTLYQQYLAEDEGEPLVDEIDLYSINNYYSAREMARLFLERSRQNMTIAFQGTSELINLEVGEVVSITHPTPAWVDKLFQVQEVALAFDGTVQITCIEYDAALYTYDTPSEEQPYVGTRLPDPNQVEPPTALTTTTGTYIEADGKAIGYIDLSWSAPEDSLVDRYELKFEYSSREEVIELASTEYRFKPTQDNVSYVISVRAVNGLGIRSTWLTAAAVTAVVDTTAPSDITGINISSGLQSITLDWTNPTEDDFDLVRIKHNTVDEEPSSHSFEVRSDSFVHDIGAYSTTKHYWLAPVDRTGNVGNYVSGGLETTGSIDYSDVGNTPTIPVVPEVATTAYLTLDDDDAPSVSEFNTAVGRNPIQNDFVVVNKEFAFNYDNGAWVAVTEFIDGSLLVTGSLSASDITTGTLNADDVTISNLTIAGEQLPNNVAYIKDTKNIAVLINEDLISANVGEAILVGYTDGSIDRATDGFITYKGQKYDIQRGGGQRFVIMTTVANKSGYIVYDSAGTQKFDTGFGVQDNYNIGFVWFDGTNWRYDNNSAADGVIFTPADTDLALGIMSTSSNDLIASAELFFEVVKLTDAPEKGTTTNYGYLDFATTDEVTGIVSTYTNDQGYISSVNWDDVQSKPDDIVFDGDITDVVRTGEITDVVRTGEITDVVRDGDITDVVRQEQTQTNVLVDEDVRTLTIPYPVTEAEALEYIINSPSAVNEALVVLDILDAEGVTIPNGVQWSLNGVYQSQLNGPDNARVEYKFVVPLVSGNNSIKIWSAGPDGGTVYSVKAYTFASNGGQWFRLSGRANTNAPSNADFETAFGREPAPRDVILVESTTGATASYYFNKTIYAWDNAEAIVHGDLIVSESITALGEVTAGTFSLGNGAFSVNSSGQLSATGAIIDGNITAESLDVEAATVTGTFIAPIGWSDNVYSGVINRENLNESVKDLIDERIAEITGGISGDFGQDNGSFSYIAQGNPDPVDPTVENITHESGKDLTVELSGSRSWSRYFDALPDTDMGVTIIIERSPAGADTWTTIETLTDGGDFITTTGPSTIHTGTYAYSISIYRVLTDDQASGNYDYRARTTVAGSAYSVGVPIQLTVVEPATVGAGNADTLDNEDGTYYLNYNNFTNTPDLSVKANLSGATFTGDVEIVGNGDTFTLRNLDNNATVGIQFTSQGESATQFGHIRYSHLNGSSYGNLESFTIGGTEASTAILADGNFLYRDGIYKKPATGTGAGIRKDTNWDTAYGWGDHEGLYALGQTPAVQISDLENTSLKTGMYDVATQATGHPDAGSSYTLNHIVGGATGSASQLAIKSNNNSDEEIYIRHRQADGTWNNWVELYHTGNFTDSSSNWDTAYGWGNHADAGYLTVESYENLQQLTFNVNQDDSATSSNYNIQGVKYSNGRILAVQNITGYTGNSTEFRWRFRDLGEASPSSQTLMSLTPTAFDSADLDVSGSITATGYNDSNWNTAYGWGNHASAGYLTSVPSEYLTQTEGDARYQQSNGLHKRIYKNNGNTGTVWYKLGNFRNTSGFVQIVGTIGSHVESFGTSRLDLTIYAREGNIGANISIDGKFEVAHQGTGVQVYRKDNDGGYESYDIWLKVGNYAQVCIDLNYISLTYDGTSTTTQPDTSVYFATEIDTTTYGQGSYDVEASAVYERYNTGNLTDNSSNWDTAYGWDDHSTQGYLTSVPAEYLTQTEGDARYHALSGSDLYKSATYPTNTFIKQSTETAYTGLTVASVGGVGVILDTNNNDVSDFIVAHGATDIDTATKLFDINGAGQGATIYLDAETSRAPVGLTLHSTVADIAGNAYTDGNFIDFKITDANATFTPQARIGMLVKDHSGDGGVLSEGAGNFTISVGQGTDASGNGTLKEALVIREDNLIATGTNYSFTAYGNILSSYGNITASNGYVKSGSGGFYVSDNQVIDSARNATFVDGAFTGGVEIAGANGAIGSEPFTYSYATGTSLLVKGNEPSIDIVGSDAGNHGSSLLLRNVNEGFGFINDPANDRLELKSFTVTDNNFQVHATGSNVDELTTLATFNKSGTVDFGGVISTTGGNSTEWNTGYDYSQVGHLPLAGGTLTGKLTLSATNPQIDFNGTSDAGVDMAIKATPEGLDFFEPEQANKIHFQILDDTGVNAPFGYNVGTTQVIDSSGNVKKSPKLTLSGDVSGTATFTDLGNATLTATVADDSHNHTHSDGDFTVSGGGLVLGNKYITKTFSTPYFTNGVSDLAVDITLGNYYINTVMEFEITGTYSSQNTTGLIRRKWYLGLNQNNGIWESPKVIDETIEGHIANQIYVSDPFWDSGASTYKIRVYHTVSTGNTYHCKISLLGASTADDLLGNLSVGSLITASTTNSHTVGLNTRSGYRVNGTTVIDSSRNLASIGNIGSSGTVTANGFNVSTLGGITQAQGEFGIGSGNVGIHFNNSGGNLLPFNHGTLSFSNGVIDFGHESYRYKDGFFSGKISVSALEVYGNSIKFANLNDSITFEDTGNVYSFNTDNGTGNAPVRAGSYQVGTTTVIDSSSNFSGVNLSLTGKATIWTNDDAPLVLRQGQSGHPWNYIEFRNSTNDRNWYAGTNSSGDFTVIGETGATGQFITNKAIRTSSGYMIDGTTVIDSNHNIKVNSNGSGNAYLHLYKYTGGDGGLLFRSASALQWQNVQRDDGGLQWYSYARAATNVIFNGLGDIELHAGDYKIGTTTVIDSSRNLTNIGTATFSGKVILGGDGAIAQIANAVAADTSNEYTLAVGSQSSSKSIIAARNINTSGGGYQINGTTVIDSSRNATFAGLTSSGTTAFTVNGITDLNAVPSAGSLTVVPFISEFQASNRSGSNYNGGIWIGARAGGYGSQFTVQANGANTPPYIRNLAGGSWGDWQKILTNKNPVESKTDSSHKWYTATTNTGTGVVHEFSDQVPNTQKGYLKYFHSDGRSHGSGNAFTLTSNQPTLSFAVDGKIIGTSFHVGFNASNSGTQIIDSARNLTNIGSINASGRLTITDDTGGNGSWTGGILIKNTGSAGEPAIAFQSDQMAGNYWIVGSNQDNELHFGYGTSFTDGGTKVIVKTDGKVGINRGAGALSNHLEVGGSILATSNITAYSDRRLKDNIKTLDGSKVYEMRGVSFTKDGELGSGVIAQELEQVAPELVLTNSDKMQTKSVAYGNVVGYLIEAIKELKLEIEELKNGNNTN